MRLDGVENVAFRGLDVYNLYESSSIGSVKCGDYWDGDFGHFEGGGHFYQRVPYLYGFTGNMAHGLMSDWSSLSMESDINIHHIYSQTGLVRGIGLYTQSKLQFYGLDGTVRLKTADSKTYDLFPEEFPVPDADPFALIDAVQSADGLFIQSVSASDFIGF